MRQFALGLLILIATPTMALAMLLAFLAISVGSAAAVQFECGFFQDKYESGKSNQGSCSMLPEKVYSTRDHNPKKNEHCKVHRTSSYEDYTEVIVDTENRYVNWISIHGLAKYRWPAMRKHYIEQGKSKEEAEKSVNWTREMRNSFEIVSYVKSNTQVHYNEVSRKAYDPPKEVPEHHLILKNKYSTRYLYIPELTGDAILHEATGMEGTSWVTIRFGKCRRVN